MKPFIICPGSDLDRRARAVIQRRLIGLPRPVTGAIIVAASGDVLAIERDELEEALAAAGAPGVVDWIRSRPVDEIPAAIEIDDVTIVMSLVARRLVRGGNA